MTTSNIGRAIVAADKNPIRRHIIDSTLVQTSTFTARLQDLTLKEVYAAFKLELATYNRKYVKDRLIRRAKALAAQEVGEFFNQLEKEQDNG